MGEGFVTNQEKLSFKEIVLQHLKKILELSTNEFRGGFYNTIYDSRGGYTKQYIGDSRKVYVQSVESLSMILIPYFDKKMNDFFEKYEKDLKGMEKKVKELVNKRIEEEKKIGVDTIKKDFQGVVNYNVSLKHLGLAHKLFKELNFLLKRVNYLKSAIYTEEDLEEEEPKDTDKQ
jgi:hypothetical protein|tara:strand:+ start:330 stop:854 length:525 start_codon:yes stop_codon:yes gene_type:complete